MERTKRMAVRPAMKMRIFFTMPSMHYVCVPVRPRCGRIDYLAKWRYFNRDGVEVSYNEFKRLQGFGNLAQL